MKKSVVFFEVEGGNDKQPDGHRKDTMPMVIGYLLVILQVWETELQMIIM